MKLLYFGVDNILSPSCEWVYEHVECDADPWCEEVDAYILCTGRHQLTEDVNWCGLDSIFDTEIVNPIDFGGLEEAAEKVLKASMCRRVVIYVTGLMPALIAVLNVCRSLKKEVTLMHYDRERNIYVAQFVY